METSFTDPTSSKGRVEEKGQRSGVETGEGGGEGGQEKAEKAAVVEDVSTQPSSSVLPNQPESATVSLSLAEPIDRNVTSCAGTVDQPEQLQVQSDSGTGTYCQEYSWKNSDKRSVVLASSQQNPYPSGITVSQPGARATNERAASDENLTQSPCNDESNSTRTSNSFNSSLGNSGNHPAPTTTPVECSDNR